MKSSIKVRLRGVVAIQLGVEHHIHVLSWFLRDSYIPWHTKASTFTPWCARVTKKQTKKRAQKAILLARASMRWREQTQEHAKFRCSDFWSYWLWGNSSLSMARPLPTIVWIQGTVAFGHCSMSQNYSTSPKLERICLEAGQPLQAVTGRKIKSHDSGAYSRGTRWYWFRLGDKQDKSFIPLQRTISTIWNCANSRYNSVTLPCDKQVVSQALAMGLEAAQTVYYVVPRRNTRSHGSGAYSSAPETWVLLTWDSCCCCCFLERTDRQLCEFKVQCKCCTLTESQVTYIR